MFSRIQNLHISQTLVHLVCKMVSLVEFKIYISLKLNDCIFLSVNVQQNSKFTYLSNKLYVGKMRVTVQQNSKFTYLSNKPTGYNKHGQFSRIQNLHISQTMIRYFYHKSMFSRIQNLHISQTMYQSMLNQFLFSRIQNLHISQTSN